MNPSGDGRAWAARGRPGPGSSARADGHTRAWPLRPETARPGCKNARPRPWCQKRSGMYGTR
eukprot:1707594-Lingulodinium_polyedra.AAC.1